MNLLKDAKIKMEKTRNYLTIGSVTDTEYEDNMAANYQLDQKSLDSAVAFELSWIKQFENFGIAPGSWENIYDSEGDRI